MQLKTPILFLIFNRPDTTERVFEQIALQKPERLYIAADGARKDKIGELEICLQTRKIIDKIAWPCLVKTLFRDENLGCKQAVSSAITWFFEHEEEGIILEDDCLPNSSFFNYCTTLLERYRHDNRVMHIAGANFQFGENRGDGDYYFSKYNHIWGWATWRRAWKNYDVNMKNWPYFKNTNQLANLFSTKREVDYWSDIFSKVHDNQINTWDYQWSFAIWCNNGLATIPNKNLICNIGFGSANATHTSNENNKLANMKTFDLEKFNEPKFMITDTEADRNSLFNTFYPSIRKFAVQKIKNILAGK